MIGRANPNVRRGFQFSLRTLLIAVVVLGLTLGWAGIVAERRRHQNSILDQLKEWDPVVEYRGGWAVGLALHSESARVVDGALIHAKGLSQLEFLDLSFTNVSDAGLLSLRDIRTLSRLHLHGTQIGDTGLEHLKAATSLRYLDLGGTNVSDEALDDFRSALPDCRINPPRVRHHRYGRWYGVRSDKTGQILEQIARDGGHIWFTEPPELSETDDLPAMPTPEQWRSAESLVMGLSFSPQGPDGLSGVGRFPELRALLLTGDFVTDESLTRLPVMKELEAFGISSSPRFTGEGLKHLRNLPRLTELTLCFVDGSRLTALPELNRLSSLKIINTFIDDCSLSQVGRLRNLVRLELGDLGQPSNVRCTTLRSLSGLTRLERLELWSFEVDPSEYRRIGGLPCLEVLRLTGGQVDDSVLRELSRLKSLTFLSLRGDGLTDVGLRYLQALERLQTLVFEYTPSPSVTGQGLAYLHQLTNLRYVSVCGASEESKQSLRKALPGCIVD